MLIKSSDKDFTSANCTTKRIEFPACAKVSPSGIFGVFADLKKEFFLMTPVGYVPDVSGQEVSLGPWHDRQLVLRWKLIFDAQNALPSQNEPQFGNYFMRF